PAGELDPLCATEGIRDEAREAAIRLDAAELVLLDHDLPAGCRYERLLEAAEHVRRLVDRGSPVPPMRAIQVDDAAARLVEAVGRLTAARDDVIAEDVAEHLEDAASGKRAKAVDANADNGLADEVDRKLRLVGFGRKRIGDGQSRGGVVGR